MSTVLEKWTPARRRELTRTALLDAAAHVFGQRGFDGASLEEIAETAGYTRGAIYKNFDSKEDLFLAVLDRRIAAQLEAFSAAFEREGAVAATDPAKMADAWWQAIVDPAWAPLDLEFRLYAMRNPEVQKRLVAQERELTKAVADFIDEQSTAMGIALNMSAAELAGIVIPATQGFAQFACLDPDGGSDLYAAFLDLLIRAVVIPEEGQAGARR